MISFEQLSIQKKKTERNKVFYAFGELFLFLGLNIDSLICISIKFWFNEEKKIMTRNSKSYTDDKILECKHFIGLQLTTPLHRKHKTEIWKTFLKK